MWDGLRLLATTVIKVIVDDLQDLDASRDQRDL
jgi:hypothetical protein